MSHDYSELWQGAAQHSLIYLVLLFGFLVAFISSTKILYHLWRGLLR